MNRFSEDGSGVMGIAIESPDGRDVSAARAIHVLFAGPLDFGSLIHDAMLDLPGFHLSITPDYHELWEIAEKEDYQVVILHSTLSSSELADATQIVRKRWPRARILVIRANMGSPEDSLHDDPTMPKAVPGVLLRRFARLM